MISKLRLVRELVEINLKYQNQTIEILGGSRFPDIQKLLVGLGLMFSFVKPTHLNYAVGRAVTIIIIFPSSGSSHAVVLQGALKCKKLTAVLSPIGC